ncbi:hypothetical protein J2Z35_002356 [Acetoanaerobium pronyense]|uniref:LUD domain-containing protein n=1 Tax=Acetoanaerobium pronyense TaxID=1482736 RepID=A0ABS4KMG3_9FIRM|nr:lactate utilization protein [Acetoanaerobium pronyense]MBP2028530.1 hypothetical protein [Acetoanaerobium pronyense]
MNYEFKDGLEFAKEMDRLDKMEKYKPLIHLLNNYGYKVSYFESIQEATYYILKIVRNSTVGFGDSQTLKKMNLFEKLSQYNKVIDPSNYSDEEFISIAKKTLTTEIYFTSVNAVSETGEMVNIDGTGNRIAGSLFGHKKVFFIFGTNKIEPTLEKAIFRTRNIAAPMNAKRLNLNTPCAIKGDRCYNCSSADRICNSMIIHMRKMDSIEAEIIMINKEL